MKKSIQQAFFTLLISLLALPALKAQGPDAFGYTWKTSNEVDGPTYNWIDITSVGTQVTGLADDNSVAFVQMGMDFHFYWSDYNKIKIGSNGWLSFDNVSNIASCFPVIPTMGGPNNLICPMMSDLNFDNGSPGKVYTYHDQTPGDEKFIISYEGVTFWTQANPIFGSSTFQVILSKADNSITFQYATMEPDFAYTCTGSGKVAAGIENLTGNIGLQVYSGTVPPSSTAVKFYYPQVITLNIIDAGPTANLNSENEGIFLATSSTVQLNTTVSNTGNTAIASETVVGAMVTSFPDGMPVYADDQSVPSLAVGASQAVNFVSEVVDWTPGTYYFDVVCSNIDDINPSNDLNSTEINVLDTLGGIATFGYVTGANAGTFIQWAGGGDGSGGGGIEIESPFYPIIIGGVEAGIAGGSTDGFTFRIFDDDGPNGGPGTELSSQTITAGDFTAGSWNQYLLENPVTITSGSFYLGWFMEGNNVGLLVETEGPLSNRSYEILSNSWAKYRTPGDIMLRAIAEIPPPPPSATKDILTDSQVEVYPNPSFGDFTIDNTKGQFLVENPRIYNTLGAVVYEGKQSISVGQKMQVQVDLPAGIFYLELKTTEGKRVVRKVAVD
ncbi:MAG: T9SS type A sorting domain-containing protein [Bacteroidetes bacterium]|nr:T9SS type A sorting domain-containing protein [Bacteroidota bacterium]